MLRAGQHGRIYLDEGILLALHAYDVVAISISPSILLAVVNLPFPVHDKFSLVLSRIQPHVQHE